jgi:hypothetical protein
MEPGLREAGYNNKAPCYNVKQHPSGFQPTAEPTGFQPVGGSVACHGLVPPTRARKP